MWPDGSQSALAPANNVRFAQHKGELDTIQSVTDFNVVLDLDAIPGHRMREASPMGLSSEFIATSDPLERQAAR